MDRKEIAERLAAIPTCTVGPDTGGIWAPFAQVGAGAWPTGALVQVVATRLPAPGSKPVPPPLVTRAWAWLCDLAGAHDQPVPASVCYLDPPPMLELSGDSPGLAVAAALLAHVLDRAPRRAVVASAALPEERVTAPIVRAVDLRPEKATVYALEAPDVPFVLAAARMDVTDNLAAWFGDTWRADLARTLGTNAWRLANDAWKSYRARSYDVAEREAEQAIALGGPERSLGYAWLVRGACRLHRAETGPALEDLLEAERRLSALHDEGEDPPDPWELEEVQAFIGVALLDAGRPQDAIARLEPALARLRAERRRDRTWRFVALQVAGTLHRARVLAGDLEGARRALEEVSLGEARLQAEAARCLGDLAEVLRRTGDPEGARQRLDEAVEALASAESGARPHTRRFLDLYRARAGLAAPTAAIEAPNWLKWPQPAEVLEALLARQGDLDAWITAHVLPQDAIPPLHILVYLSVAARRGGPTPAWAFTLADRLAADPKVEETVAALGRGVREGGLGEFVRRSPY
jgi:tetratricopeptide (TPR) repeat protein